jgi:para-aminobenzoate synthetase/4-amino-4-deoxychorismate lyase
MHEYVAVIRDPDSSEFLFFAKPVKTLISSDLNSIISILEQVEELAAQGFWCLGYISYEASPAFDSNLKIRTASTEPLIAFHVFDSVEKRPRDPSKNNFFLSNWQSELNLEQYQLKAAQLKTEIQAGNTYQTNFTFRIDTAFEGDPLDCFFAFVAKQEAAYSTFLLFDHIAICSASPELFFERSDTSVISKPMKGTARRLSDPVLDSDSALKLKQSDKERAENVMVVDLIRNDLSRIAETGSVHAKSVFDIEELATVWQMTSTVSAEVNQPTVEIWKALFPCASITGAPKAQTMQIITDLEISARSIYTGSICTYFPGPQKRVRANVAIRTIEIDQLQKRARYGVGSGFTWHSNSENEYQECLLKAEATPQNLQNVKILETILFEVDKGYFLLDPHLKRLKETASFFVYPYCEQIAIQLLELAAKDFEKNQRCRLLLDSKGKFELKTEELNNLPSPFSLKLAKEPLDSNSLFVRFKTDQRHIYESLRRDDCDDTILFNNAGQLCETCIGNVVYKINNEWFTPPSEVGLLKGIYRQSLLEQGVLREAVLRIEDMKTVEAFAIINSVRGWVPAQFLA